MSSANRTDGRIAGEPSGLSRYDLVLAVVPVGFVLAAMVGRILSLSQAGTLAIGSLVGLLAVLDALVFSLPA